MNSTTGIVGASRPPPGVTPNFMNPESIGYRLLIIAVLLPFFTLAVCLLRLYTSRWIVKRAYLDDLFIVIAFTFAVANSAVCIAQLGNGAGRHMWDVSMNNYKMFLKLGNIGGSLTYNLATTFIKASILQFYLRFPSGRLFRAVVYLTMLVAVGYSLPQAFAWTYYCVPMARFWDRSIPGTCITGDTFLISASMNVATDFIILLLPIWLLWPLRMATAQKVALTGVMMAGGFVCAVSVVRLQAITSGLRDPDITWHYVTNLIWCLVEMYTGIICACLPCLQAFFRHHFPNMFSVLDRRQHAMMLSLDIITDINSSGMASKQAAGDRNDSESGSRKSTVGAASTNGGGPRS